MPLPQNAEPVGPIAALGGAVWVPLRDGLLEFDPAGNLRPSHPPARRRPTAGSRRWASARTVTDGRTVRSLDVPAAMSDPITYGPEILGLASAGFDGRVLLAPENGGLEHARGSHARRRTRRWRSPRRCPTGSSRTASPRRPRALWATGTVDGAPAIALLDDDGVRATVVLENATGGAALGVDRTRTRCASCPTARSTRSPFRRQPVALPGRRAGVEEGTR